MAELRSAIFWVLNCPIYLLRCYRKILSFSKKLENHIGAICNFIHHYNTSLPACASFPF